MVRPLAAIATTLLSTLVFAQGPLEPNPEFDPGNVDLQAFIDPATDILIEPEELASCPDGWRVVTSEWLRTGGTGGETLLLLGGEGDGKEEFPSVVTGRDERPFLRAYGDTTSTMMLPKRTDHETRRKAASHSHYCPVTGSSLLASRPGLQVFSALEPTSWQLVDTR